MGRFGAGGVGTDGLGGGALTGCSALTKVAFPLTPNPDFEVTAAVEPPDGVKVQAISLSQPALQVMVLPLMVAGWFVLPILTDVPSVPIANATLMLPNIPWLIIPDQFPAKRAAPVNAAVLADWLSVPELFVLAGCFHLGFDVWAGAGGSVGLSGVSTIGAGDRSVPRKTMNRVTMIKRGRRIVKCP